MVNRRRNNPPSCARHLLLWLGCLCPALLFPLNAASPVVLHLRNGDRLTGEIVSEDPARLTLTNSLLGRFSIPLTAIARRESPTNTAVAKTVPVPAATNSAAPSLPPAMQRKLDDLQTLFVTGGISADEFQRQRTKLISPPQLAKPKHWTAEVFAGLDLLYSEKDRQLYTGRAKLAYTKAPLRNNIDYLFTYGWTDGELTANRMDGWMKTDWDLTPRSYVYNLAGAGYDEIRLVDWRYEVGPGLGYHLFKRTNFVLRAEAGFHYQVQDFEGGREEKTYNQRLAQDLRWNIGANFSFDEKVEYFPSLEDLHSYRLRTEANLRYWLKSNLSLNLTVIDTYETSTARGVGQNDLQIRSSIGVKF